MVEYTLSRVIEETGVRYKNRSRLFQTLSKNYQDYIIKSRQPQNAGGVISCEIWFTKEIFPEIIRTIKNRQPSRSTEGCVYGFETLLHKNNYKFGKARNWNTRSKGYHGHNTIGSIVLLENVSNHHESEKKLLRFIRECGHFRNCVLV